jgi:hypothetical protein
MQAAKRPEEKSGIQVEPGTNGGGAVVDLKNYLS